MGETLYVKSLIKTLYVQSITGGTLSAEFVMEETIFTESSVEGTFYVKFTIKNKNTWQSLKLMKHILGNIFCWVYNERNALFRVYNRRNTLCGIYNGVNTFFSDCNWRNTFCRIYYRRNILGKEDTFSAEYIIKETVSAEFIMEETLSAIYESTFIWKNTLCSLQWSNNFYRVYFGGHSFCGVYNRKTLKCLEL